MLLTDCPNRASITASGDNDAAPTKSHGGSKLGRLCRCARAPAQHHDPDVDAMEFGQAAQRLEQLEDLRPLDERTAGTRTVE